MADLTDNELLADFARTESEEAFAILVKRYVNLVYSTALRFTGNSGHAEEITQAVFIILAQKAGKLSARVMLSGWLYQATRLTAANFMKAEIRRQRREQEAYMQSQLSDPDPAAWRQIAPLLEDAMGHLGETDRDAVVLRFFENKTAAEVASTLHLTEAATAKRTSRALDKLRKFFLKHGVNSTASTIAVSISTHSVHTAPAALIKSAAVVAATKGATASGSTVALAKGALKIMAWTKTKTTIVTVAVTALIAAGGGAYFFFSHPPHPAQHGRLKLPSGDVTPQVGFGRTRGIVLAPDGSLWAWGQNDLGWPALGLGNRQYTAMLTRIGNDNDWASVAVGQAHNLALKKDGALWGWGQNLRNQLGTHPSILRPKGNLGTGDMPAVPVQSELGSGWKQIAAGADDSFGIKDNGTLWAWGLNNFGQLGIGNFTSSPAPVQIGSPAGSKSAPDSSKRLVFKRTAASGFGAAVRSPEIQFPSAQKTITQRPCASALTRIGRI